MATLPTHGIVDAHLHVWPDSHPDRPYPWTVDPHPVEDLLPVLDAAGVDAAIQVTPLMMQFDNGYGFDAATRLPQRIGVFGRFDADAPRVRERLERFAAEPGALGVRLTFFGATREAHGALRAKEEFWSTCEELDVPVAVLAPDSLPELAAVARDHPRMRLIVDHLGLGVYEGSVDPFAGWPHLAELAACASLRIKISTLVETSREGFPFRDVHERLAEAVELFGVERLVWGSNYPVVTSVGDYAASLRFLEHCDFLTDEDLLALTSRNVRAFLGWPQAVLA